MAELTQQGYVRKANPTNLSPLEDWASVFVRWKQETEDLDRSGHTFDVGYPYLYCDTFAYAQGPYYRYHAVLISLKRLI